MFWDSGLPGERVALSRTFVVWVMEKERDRDRKIKRDICKYINALIKKKKDRQTIRPARIST